MKKALLWIAFGFLGFVGFLSTLPATTTPAQIPTPLVVFSAIPTPSPTRISQPVVPSTSPIRVYEAPTPNRVPTYTPIPQPDLSNDNYYKNVDGDQVHAPAYAPNRPAGASARCRDGTYSFSQNRRGTCSHHGGVAEWY